MARKRKLNPIFEPKTAAVIQDAVQWVEDNLADAKADLGDLIISAAHVAGYGKAVAHASSCGIVELTEGNHFSEIKMRRGGYVMRNEQRLHDLVVHEVAHVIVGWAKTTNDKMPWDNIPAVSPSTHQCASWLWVCAKGWSQFHGVNIDPNDLSAMARDDKPLRSLLSAYAPSRLPKRYVTQFKNIAAGKAKAPSTGRHGKMHLIDCQRCGVEFEAVKRTAKFCSATCRSQAARAAKVAAE